MFLRRMMLCRTFSGGRRRRKRMRRRRRRATRSFVPRFLRWRQFGGPIFDTHTLLGEGARGPGDDKAARLSAPCLRRDARAQTRRRRRERGAHLEIDRLHLATRRRRRARIKSALQKKQETKTVPAEEKWSRSTARPVNSRRGEGLMGWGRRGRSFQVRFTGRCA